MLLGPHTKIFLLLLSLHGTWLCYIVLKVHFLWALCHLPISCWTWMHTGYYPILVNYFSYWLSFHAEVSLTWLFESSAFILNLNWIFGHNIVSGKCASVLKFDDFRLEKSGMCWLEFQWALHQECKCQQTNSRTFTRSGHKECHFPYAWELSKYICRQNCSGVTRIREKGLWNHMHPIHFYNMTPLSQRC